MGNSSDQVGRNLMDHHKGLSINADVDGFEDSYYYGRRPTGIFMPRFRNVSEKRTDYVRGYFFGAGAGRSAKHETSLGAEFKDSLCEPGGWKMNMWSFGECLPYSSNRVTLNHNKKDQWGRPMIAVNCEFKENEKAMHQDMAATAKEIMEAAGFKNVSVTGSMSFPGNANHEMGVARMGRDPKNSVLNPFNQLHEVPNIFVTDGSCMVSSSCVNPSLTYMALTARACDYAVKELKKQNI
jgi:choline dehydrogenase-like flavoprotein